MTTPRPGRLTALLLLGAATVACPGRSEVLGGDADPKAILQGAIEHTRAEGSAAFDVEFSVGTGARTVTTHADGRYDFDRKTGELAFVFPGVPREMGFEFRLFGRWIYWHGPGLEPDRPWARAPPSWVFDPFGDGPGTDPTEILDAILRSARVTEDRGVDDIVGTAARRLTVSVDLDAAARRVDVENSDTRFSRVVEYLPKRMPADVWFDDRGRLRRFAFTAPEMGGRLAFAFVFEFQDFGVAVEVERPPKDEVVGDFPPFGVAD